MSAAVEMLGLVVSATVLMAAAVTALTSASVLKRLAAVLAALMASALAIAALDAPSAMVVSAVALMLAYCIIGVGILVRLQEAYGGGDAIDVDAADDQAETGRDA